MKAWQNTLKKSMQHPAAELFVQRLNAEEQLFKSTVNQVQFKGRGLVNVPAGVFSNNWMLLQGRTGKMLVNECKRRPNIEWTTDTRMSKVQATKVELLIGADWKVWCAAEMLSTGARAILMKLDTVWALVYEDGSVTKGVVPNLKDAWPRVLKQSKEQKAKVETYVQSKKLAPVKMNADGSMSLTRYTK